MIKSSHSIIEPQDTRYKLTLTARFAKNAQSSQRKIVNRTYSCWLCENLIMFSS